MSLIEVMENIGKHCIIGGGDIAIRSDVRHLVINNEILTIAYLTKSGLVRLKKDNQFYTVPARNVHLL